MDLTLTPAIGYIRVTNPAVVTDSEDQRVEIELWAARTGHLMVGWVEDILTPRGSAESEALAEVCERLVAGEARVVAVSMWDRLSRKLPVRALWVARIESAGGSLAVARP